MKNHVAIKFIAILLCAASLLGVVGCGLGVFALTELDLYDKTVDQVYEERIQQEGRSLAYNTAMYYACSELGGCPQQLVYDLYGDDGRGLNPFYYGYQLKDAEGNVLMSQDLPSGSDYTVYTFPVTGQYMHLVDTTTASQQAAQVAEQVASRYTVGEGAVLHDAIPAEGAEVHEYQIATTNSSVGGSGYSGGTFVFRNQDGQVIFRDPGLTVDPEMANEAVTSLTLYGADGELLFDAAWYTGIGSLRLEPEGGLTFFSNPDLGVIAAEAAEETVPMTTAPVEASAPATEAAEETVPAETVTEETAEATEAEASTEATEAETAEETQAAEETEAAEETTAEETAAAETTAETEADSEAEAAPAKEDSEGEPAAEGTEATEETVAPTVPETIPEETVPQETVPQETVPQETVPQETIPEPVMINGKPLDTYQINRTEYYDDTTGDWTTARYVYLPMEELTLELSAAPGVLRAEASYALMRIVRQFRGYLFPAMGICLLIFAICAVYLCCAAGKKPKSDEIRPGGLNRIPLDLYGFCVLGGVTGLCVAIAEGGDYVLRQNVMVGCAFMAGLGYLAALLVVGFLFACVAQCKAPNGFWWRNSLCGLCLKLCGWLLGKTWKLCVRLEEWANAKGWPLLVRLFKWAWGLIRSIWLWFWGTLKRIYLWLYD